jgi:iron complex transport system substrate-binding protein
MIRRRVLLFLLWAALAWGQRDVVSLSAPLTETVYLLGQQHRLAAVSDTSVFPPEVVADRESGKVRTLPFSRTDLDAVAALKPSLILTSTAFQRETAARLRERGFRVLHFEPESLEAIFRQTEEIGAALGKAEEAAALARNLRAEIRGIEARSAALRPVRVYMEINHEGPWTAGGRSPETDIIRIAGGVNVFADVNQGVFVTTNAEVVKRDPEVILSPIWVNAHVGGIDGITTLAEILSRPGYASTTAAMNGRVLYYDSALLKHQGPRVALAIRKLAYLLHPEVFENPPGTIPWELGRIKP